MEENSEKKELSLVVVENFVDCPFCGSHIRAIPQEGSCLCGVYYVFYPKNSSIILDGCSLKNHIILEKVSQLSSDGFCVIIREPKLEGGVAFLKLLRLHIPHIGEREMITLSSTNNFSPVSVDAMGLFSN